jgi:hypothetical protein
MNRPLKLAATSAALFVLLALAGCAAPAALEHSQRLQLAAIVQYRDEMAAYHAKVKAQLAEEKQSQLDTALAASLAQAADAEGRVPVGTALEKFAKRQTLDEQFRANVARLDAEFAQRQEAIGRAVELAQDTLDLLADYGRLSSLIRSLFGREVEADEIVKTYETQRSVTDAGSPSQPEASSR